MVFVDTNAKKERIAVLKSSDMLKQLDDDGHNVFQKSLIDRYQHRPEQISSMCLAEFTSTYCTSYNAKMMLTLMHCQTVRAKLVLKR